MGETPIHDEADALVRTLEGAGIGTGDLPGLVLGDLDSLLLAELVLVLEELLGRTLDVAALDVTMPVEDLLVMARELSPRAGPR